jgi:protein arginine N-methyltransferase 5
MYTDDAGIPLTNTHNTRSSTHTFLIPHAGQLHGLAGYFESHLYSNVGLSIHPENAHRVSPDMFSWFPLYFPFKEPLYLPAGAELDVSVWRLWDGDRRRVWYEWCAEGYLSIPGGGLTMARDGSHSALTPQRIVSGVGQSSPMMDAPISPGLVSPYGPNGIAADSRVKIGQTSLHNAGGVHSWVGL